MMKLKLQFFGGRGSAGGNKSSAGGNTRERETTSNGFKLNSNVKNKLDELNSKAKDLGVTDRRLVVGFAPEAGDRATLYIEYSNGKRSEQPVAYLNSISEKGEVWVVVGDKTKKTLNSALNSIYPVDKRFGTR